jgi:hypothetical protein
MRFEPHHIAVRIFNVCLQNAVNLDIQWIPKALLHGAIFHATCLAMA